MYIQNVVETEVREVPSPISGIMWSLAHSYMRKSNLIISDQSKSKSKTLQISVKHILSILMITILDLALEQSSPLYGGLTQTLTHNPLVEISCLLPRATTVRTHRSHGLIKHGHLGPDRSTATA